MASTVVYVSNADSAEISVLALDEASGALTTLQTLPCGGMVMPLALAPSHAVLYAGIRSEPWRVLALRIAPADGTLAVLGEAPLPASMAHLSVDGSGHWLFAASYHGDLLSLAALDAAGSGDRRDSGHHRRLPACGLDGQTCRFRRRRGACGQFLSPRPVHPRQHQPPHRPLWRLGREPHASTGRGHHRCLGGLGFRSCRRASLAHVARGRRHIPGQQPAGDLWPSRP